MAYALQDLLRIRQMREQMAKDSLIKAQNYLEETIRQVEQKKKELEDFRVWRVEEEDRLYAEIMNKKIRRMDLDGLKAKLAKLEKKELEHEQAVDDAQAEREKAKEDLETARNLYNQALIGVQKIQEHKDSWMEEWKKEQEMIEEKETEDFRALQVEY